ncbi:D-alanyl-D-alanine carboxypeptidase [Streptomyces endophytica]|uniref:D-alanyl-D-alanine carboxypeptidase n=1 Tax=Streptomyces endophytica TaxID=2991496 RepID=A0ABY6P8D9_9ACTN|nr:D-alanyl-D-alanine carboxypeptidase [Streptomyces endophytica]UZJ30061.1 D-alanyl-D-alanine carboxypeptidase [Streptomyces endophytica]
MRDGAAGAAGKAGGAPASASAKAGDGEDAQASTEADGADNDEGTQASTEANRPDNDEGTQASTEANEADNNEGTQASTEANRPDNNEGTQASTEANRPDSGKAGQSTGPAKPGATGSGKADQDTAASGASKAAADGASTAEAGAASGAAGDGKADQAPGKPGATGGGKADQATAVFGAVKSGIAEGGKAEQATDKPGAASSGKAPEGEAKSGPEAASRGAGADGDDKPKEDSRLKTAVAEAEDDSDSDSDGDSDGDGDGDGDGDDKAGSVDQATQLLAAPKPAAAGSADQPTRLLKAPANPDSESERTSQFIPLKKDDAPAPKPLKAPKPEAKPNASPPAPPKPAAAPPADSPAEPQAPLDLLAQLTNTPPPPETLVRTVVRRVKIWTPLVVLLGIIFVVVQTMRPLPDPKLAIVGKSSSVFEGDTPSLSWPPEGQAIVDVDGLGRVGSYGEMKPLPIGSVAKVMTTYIILRDHPLKKGEDKPLIDVDQKAEDDFVNGVRVKESVVEVHKGQKISEKEALQAVMLPSANNVARLLARWDASTEAAFIKKMNDTAKELGMTNTTYTDASGLLESTVSTAEDQVKLGKKAMQDPVFREISKSTEYHSTTASGKGSGLAYQKTQRNFNKLVPMYGVVGIKTGSTTKAGGNLLFAAEKKVGSSTQLIIGAVFGQHKTPIIDTATAYSKQLILAVGKALTTSTVVKKGAVVGQVDDGLGGTTPLVATKDLTVVGWPGLKVDLKLTAGGKALPHTAKAGTQVGELTAGGGMGEVKVPVVLQKDLAEPSFGAKLTRVS